MKIKTIHKTHIDDALNLDWEVFIQTEGKNYSDEGKKAFNGAIHDKSYLDDLIIYGAFEDKELLGVIALRNGNSQVALFFVRTEYQNRGIGRALWNKVLSENTNLTINVHSSIYASSIYEKLGFVKSCELKEENGIMYIPMVYKMKINNSCPCKRIKCKHHGHCNECRAKHSFKSGKCACERLY